MTTELKSIPLVVQPSNRTESTATDAKIINAIVERQADGQVTVMRRPAFTQMPNETFPAGTGFVTDVYAYWASASQFYTFIGYQTGAGTVIRQVASDGSATTLTTLSPDDYNMITSQANPLDLICYTGGSAHVVNITTAVVTNIAAWPGTPGNPIVGRMIYLDGIFYALRRDGKIFNSNVNDPLTWNPLNFINVYNDNDLPLRIVRQLTQIAVLKTGSVEFFYNANRPAGSPLARNDSAKINAVGVEYATSVAEIDDSVMWVGSTDSGGRCVVKMTNLTPTIVSTPSVDRLLQNLGRDNTIDRPFGYGFRLNGHTYYVLTNESFTLVYDMTADLWYEWTVNGTGLPFKYSVYNMDYTGSGVNRSYPALVHPSDGHLYVLNFYENQDSLYFFGNLNIPVDIYTPLWDMGIYLKKYCNKLELHGDQKSAGTVSVRVTDDDYQTWTSARDVPMSDGVATLVKCGTFRRRAWHIRHDSVAPFRVTNLVAHISLGTS